MYYHFMEQNMQNNINNNERDAFSELFREKLEGHTAPVDAGSWDAIQAGLKARKRKKIIPLWWFYSGAAVLVLLFTVGSFMFNKTDTDRMQAKQISVHKTGQMKQNAVAVVLHNKITTADNKNVVVKSTPDNHQHESAGITVTEVLITDQNAVNPQDVAISDVKEAADKPDDEKTVLTAEKVQKMDQLLPEDEMQKEWTDPLKNDDDKDWTLMAGLMSGSGATVNANSEVLVADVTYKSSIVRAPTRNTTILSPSDFANRTYMAPLGFGFKAAKNLNRVLSVETGLVYTYMQTNFTDTHVNAELSLHYLGVPLNLSVQILQKPGWRLYSSAGVMVEKGLRSYYAQHEYVGSNIIHTNASTGIQGLQWSAQMAAGAAFRLFRELEVYVEPKMSYYFENNQPISIRVDKKFSGGLEGGIRFDF